MTGSLTNLYIFASIIFALVQDVGMGEGTELSNTGPVNTTSDNIHTAVCFTSRL